ncbi:mitochondrial carrier domain-containing protein [Umbelopsis sp. AD052]|nr:mitochondrial carrier domain-containing protein [Umbelopsis sp. AD052]
MTTQTTVVPTTSFTIPKFAQDVIAGTIGGWAQVVVGHPFDTIKVRMQTQPSPPVYKNAVECFQSLFKAEGPKGLYRGVTSPLAGIGICNAVLFTANGNFRRMLQGNDPNKELSLGEIGVAGMGAGLVMAFFNCPVELLKVKLQTQSAAGVIGANGKLEPPYKGVIDCGIRTSRASGILGLYRGMGITLLRDVPSFASYFITYEGLKKLFQAMKKDPENNPLTSFELLMAGGLAGFGAWIPAYPQDVIKSRLQNDLSYKSARHVVATIMKTTGPKAFFNGIGPTLARAFPANAATFFAYETAMKAMA